MAAPHDAVGPQHAFVDIREMHRGAHAFADTPGFTHQLCNHARDIDALGDAMTMTPVSAGDVVAIRKVSANSDCDCFLAGVKMDEAGDQSIGEVLARGILECSDLYHALVHFEQFA